MTDRERDGAGDLLAGVDAPRPLSADLRARLEQQLLGGTATTPVALGEALDERLEETLTDPLAAALRGVDDPRALPPGLRARLESQLSHATSRRRLPHAFVGAAAALVLLAAVAVLAVRPAHHPPTASSAADAPSTATSAGVADGVTTGGPAVGTGGTGGTGGTVAGSSGVDAPAAVPGPASGHTTSNLTAGGTSGTAAGPAAFAASPDAGPLAGGTRVTVRGSGLRQTVAVSFGGRSASYRVGSDSVVIATTPAAGAPRSVDIRIRLADGSTVVLARAFSYLPRPRVDGVSPAMGGTAGGTWVTLRGVALRRTTQVLFGTVAATRVRVVADTELRVLSPRHLPGPVDVRVTTPGGTSDPTSRDRFTYLA